MERPSSDEEYARLWGMFARTRDAMLKARQKELAIYNILPRQAYMLQVIQDLGDKATINEIAKQTSRKHHTVSTLITRMVKNGYLEKKRDIPGTNLLRFVITEKGLEVCKFVRKRESMHTVIDVLTPEERKQLQGFLYKLLNKSLEIGP